MTDQELIQQYLDNGGKVTKLPDGKAEDALECDSTHAMWDNKKPKATVGWDHHHGTEEYKS